MVARVGSISAPYVLVLVRVVSSSIYKIFDVWFIGSIMIYILFCSYFLQSTIYTDLPTIIFAISALASALIAILLPETKDKILFQHVNEVEEEVESKVRGGSLKANGKPRSKSSQRSNAADSTV